MATIDDLIARYGYTRRILLAAGYDTNLGLIKDAIGSHLGEFMVGDIQGGFIPITLNGKPFGYIYASSRWPQDNHAYDGDRQWKESQKMQHGLTDIELDIKIHLDTLIHPEEE